jgi:hypothetical protein
MNIQRTIALLTLPLLLCSRLTFADDEIGAFLKFENGRAISELSKINEVLRTVGVHLERIEVPQESIPLLEASLSAPLSAQDRQKILDLFSLSRDAVINQAKKAGRKPVIAGGGSMTSGEIGVAPYPKVYDLKAMSPDDRLSARNKFGRLHINSTDDQVGVDEVMTLPVGGAWTWYFLVGDEAVELHMSRVNPGDRAWRLTYPGLAPHGAYFYSTDGLCIAYITGPESWTMRYEAPGLANSDLIGKNPFLNFDNP